jgi:hypothetical protein
MALAHSRDAVYRATPRPAAPGHAGDAGVEGHQWVEPEPDGTRLAVATQHNLIALWDLRRLREELTALGLDWDMPPYPPTQVDRQAVEPLQVEILPAEKAAR